MNAVAMEMKSARNHEADICRFRKRDYVGIVLFFTWLSVTAAFLILSTLVIIVLSDVSPDGYMPVQNPGITFSLWIAGYVIMCIFPVYFI